MSRYQLVLPRDELPRTRTAAIAAGSKWYFTGKPCKHGHVEPRTIKGGCVECHRIRANQNYDRAPEPTKKRATARYARRRVEVPDEIRDYGRKQIVAWRAANPGAAAAIQRRWRKANPEKASARDRRDYERRDPVKRRNTNRLRYARPSVREKRREQHRAWIAAHSDERAAHYRNKRAQRRKAEGKHTAADIAKMRIDQNDSCNICGEFLLGKGHIDHIIPLAKDGSNWVSNLQLLCKPCNEWKAVRLPHELVIEIFTKARTNARRDDRAEDLAPPAGEDSTANPTG